ncbi:MAG: hypothetical protein D6806_12500 [Deltaproteobacteria bacterium]|nr:MAG: hypothetical protein D6806_12500 [Deltaproteobacteria bacterium]
MPDELLTTFSTGLDFVVACERLSRLGIDHRVIEPPHDLCFCPVPALVMTREARAAWEKDCSGRTGCSGWVDYRPEEDTALISAGACYEEDAVGQVAICVLQPCVADETKIRFVAECEKDMDPVLPYLNAVMSAASYNPQARSLTFLLGQRLVSLGGRRITVAKADGIVDAWRCLDRVKGMLNEAWARRSEIEPCFESRSRPPALELLKRLPGDDCGACGELTCMAFALRLWSGEVKLSDCRPLYRPENEERLRALRQICAGLGVMDESEPVTSQPKSSERKR